VSQVYTRIACSASTFCEPVCIENDPGPCYHEQTRFIVSYKVSEFNETEFEEYDPTAFGGGYDPAATYGKPLPPSDKICYPSSTPDPNALSLMVSPMDRLQHLTEKLKSMNLLRNLEVKGNRLGFLLLKQRRCPLEHGNGKGNSQEKSLVLHKGEESEENEGDHHDSLPGYDAGYCNGSSGELGYEYGQEVHKFHQDIYGLEAMDLCESYLVTGLVFLAC